MGGYSVVSIFKMKRSRLVWKMGEEVNLRQIWVNQGKCANSSCGILR